MEYLRDQSDTQKRSRLSTDSVLSAQYWWRVAANDYEKTARESQVFNDIAGLLVSDDRGITADMHIDRSLGTRKGLERTNGFTYLSQDEDVIYNRMAAWSDCLKKNAALDMQRARENLDSATAAYRAIGGKLIEIDTLLTVQFAVAGQFEISPRQRFRSDILSSVEASLDASGKDKEAEMSAYFDIARNWDINRDNWANYFYLARQSAPPDFLQHINLLFIKIFEALNYYDAFPDNYKSVYQPSLDSTSTHPENYGF